MSIDVINAHFHREGMHYAEIDNVLLCDEVETDMLKSRDPILQISLDHAGSRILWVNVTNQSNLLTDRLKHEIPIIPASCNNYVIEWDNGTRWVLRYVVGDGLLTHPEK